MESASALLQRHRRLQGALRAALAELDGCQRGFERLLEAEKSINGAEGGKSDAME